MNGYLHGSDSLNLAEEYSSYNNPSVEQQPDLVPVEEKLPYTPTLEGERPVNGKPIEWAPEDLNKPLIFPLKPIYQLRDPAIPQPSSIQPQSTSLNAASSNGIPQSLSSDDSTHYASAPDYYEPASIFTSHTESWQPEPIGEGYGEADLGSDSQDLGFKSGYSADGGDWNNRRLVFEEVFQYPSEYTGSSQNYGAISNAAGGYSKGSVTEYASNLKKPSFPSRMVDVESQSVYKPGMQSSYPSSFTGGENLNFGQTSYQPHSLISSWLPQKPVTATQKEVFQTGGEQDKNYVIHPRDGYLLNKFWHSPELLPLVPMSLTGDKTPVESTSHPKVVKIVKGMTINYCLKSL